MREIKFRVWVPKFNSFLKNYNNSEEIGIRTVGVFNNLYQLPYMPSDEYVAQQYTGLKDKNGVEIYEGDIIEEYIIEKNYKTSYVSEVLWSNHGWHVLHREEYTSFEILDFDKLEIIGNIFENPELLEK